MYEIEIQRGMAWLDDTEPDWKAQYKLGPLDMSKISACVLGRVFQDKSEAEHFSGYHYACATFELSDDWLLEHGFCANIANYPRLTAEWTEALAKVGISTSENPGSTTSRATSEARGTA